MSIVSGITNNIINNVVRNVIAGGGAAPFSPADIANLQAWYDASADGTNGRPNTITSAGGKVSQWDDRSGNGNHATQNNGTNQPTTGTRTVNSKNVIDFDGSTQELIITNSTFLSYVDAGDYTVFTVYAPDNFANRVFTGGQGSSSRFSLRLNSSSTISFYTRVGSNTDLDLSENMISGNVYLAYSDLNGNDGMLSQNEDSVEYSDFSTASTDNYVLGGRSGATTDQQYDGVIAEHIFYNRFLTISEKNQIGNYLADKWGITWSNIT